MLIRETLTVNLSLHVIEFLGKTKQETVQLFSHYVFWPTAIHENEVKQLFKLITVLSRVFRKTQTWRIAYLLTCNYFRRREGTLIIRLD